MTKFYHAIEGTGFGKILKIIDIWKKLPDNKELKKKKMMLNTVNKALNRIREQVSLSFRAFREWHQVGEEKKRIAALTMIKTSGGSLQQSWKKW